MSDTPETQAPHAPQTFASLLAHRLPDSPAAPAPRDPTSDDDVTDVAGAVRLLSVGRNKVYEMMARNESPHRRFGRRIRFSRAAIVAWDFAQYARLLAAAKAESPEWDAAVCLADEAGLRGR